MSRLEPAPAGWLPGVELLLKREDEHELGAFKWRAAEPVIEAYRAAGHGAVVTASTGNHGAATAWAARRNGVRAVVFVPAGTSPPKLELLRRLEAELVDLGSDLDEAKAAAMEHARAEGLPFFEDGAEPLQYEAYGAIADEILDEVAPQAVVVPVGNGALLAGVGGRLGERAPGVRRIGVAAAAAPVMSRSFAAGAVVESEDSATFADGMAVRVAIPRAVDALLAAADEMVEVSERAIAEAVRDYARAGMRVEGSAAASLAGARAAGGLSGTVVLLVTGRNIADELWRRAVDRPETFG
ncbi:MAG TPA: pyridoxal-phosphate dependent enzyme [Gaiellales bacterium]|nr:pyridoxal-phosphate dependent enzyme [Gaiellales bacterium]